MRKKLKPHLKLEEFGAAIGLNSLDKALIRQKNLVIDRLKSIRLTLGLTQAALARKVGTHQPAIARMEAGQVGEVSFDFLIRVALAMGRSLEVITLKKAA